MPAQIFNTDKSGFRYRSQVGLCSGMKRMQESQSKYRRLWKKRAKYCELLGAASGKMLPPYVVYRSKNLHKEWIVSGPGQCAYPMSTNGWMEETVQLVYVDWFEKIFLKHIADVSDKMRVLVFDCHSSHLSLSLLLRRREKIMLFFFACQPIRLICCSRWISVFFFQQNRHGRQCYASLKGHTKALWERKTFHTF